MRIYLKELRETNNLSQQDVSILIGISQQAYSLIEKGDRQQDMKLSTLQRISEIFNVNFNKILELENLYIKKKEK